jgi:predicted transcriptional regulator
MPDPVAPTFPPDVRRHVVRLAGDFFLKSARIISTAIDTDLVTGMIFLAIVRANVRHLLEEPGAALDYFEPGDAPPEAFRRPVSVYAIARELRLPYETARRHIGKLLAKGLCERGGDGGVVFPPEVNDRPEVRQAVITNFDATVRYVRALADVGLVATRGPAPGAAVSAAFRPREVVRLSSDYFLNTVELLTSNLDLDLVEGLMFLAIVRANTLHVTHDPVLAATYSGVDEIPPDALRRSVSVYALARDLRLPYETARRHGRKLLDLGLCERASDRGLVVPTHVHAREDFKASVEAYGRVTQAFVNALAQAGLVLS